DKRRETHALSNYTDSRVPGRDKPKSFTGSIPWFTTTNLVDKGFIKKTQDTFGLTESEINEVRAKIIPVGSIIMTCVGDLGILSINREPCIVNQQLHTYQCDENTNSIYLMFCLSFMKSYMYKMASTTTVPYMNKTICNSIPVIHPPIELQNQFSEIFEKAEAIKEQFKRSLKDLENLYGSLRQRAFKGELDLSKLDISDWENFDGGETEQDPVKRSEIQKYFDEAEKKIKSGALNYLEQPHGDPFDIDEAAAKKQGAQFYKEWKKLNPKKKKSKLTWDRVSTEQVANWIKENYTGYHFTSEMLIRFLMDEHVTFPDYYSTEELKKNPKANDADDLKTLIFSSLNNENPFLKLEQVFYNAELDNINLTLRDEDFNLIKTRAKQERTGVYLQIAK
ncbi:MAG: restriction endonuclease subunit S, partial [Bacteroidia bacterium]